MTNPGFGIKKEYLLRESEGKTRSAYMKLMVNVATILGLNKTEAHKEFDEILKLKVELAKVSIPDPRIHLNVQLDS